MVGWVGPAHSEFESQFCLPGLVISLFFFFLFKDLFIHRDTHREREREREAETQAEGESGFMREPNVGLDPGTPGSHPGPKAGSRLLSHPGIPSPDYFNQPKTEGSE